MKKIEVTIPFSDNLLEKIKTVADNIRVQTRTFPDRQWPEDETSDAEILYTAHAIPRPEQAPNLRWVQVHWAGIESLFDTPLWHSDILITSASGIHAPNMAQYALTQMLAWAHRVPTWLKYQRQGEWPSHRWNKFLPDELRSRTLGIVGYGSIGREIARLAKSFGMTILANKRDARHPEDKGFILPHTGDPEGRLPDRLYPGEALRSMLAECDYVVITLPHTSKTHHLFDESVFREMKPNAFLVNIGRGQVIDEKDLIKALKREWIAGAGLDVFEDEPLPADSPLWRMENVIITPHVSGFTPYYDERTVDLFTHNLRLYLDNQPLLNVVNREQEY